MIQMNETTAEQDRKAALRTRLANDFTYHAPFGTQVERYAQIRDAAKQFALLLTDLTPVSREQSLALTALQEAVMWANASIAVNETQE